MNQVWKDSKFKSIVLSIDIMPLNQIPFLVSKSYHVNHYQVRALDNFNTDCVSSALESIYSEYSIRGWKVTWIETNNEFELICEKFSLKEALLITCDADYHVPRV